MIALASAGIFLLLEIDQRARYVGAKLRAVDQRVLKLDASLGKLDDHIADLSARTEGTLRDLIDELLVIKRENNSLLHAFSTLEKSIAKRSEGVETAMLDLLSAVATSRDETHRELARATGSVEDRLDSAKTRILQASRSVIDQLEAAKTQRGKRHWELRHMIRDQTREIEALFQLYGESPYDHPMPAAGRWALDPSALVQLLDLVRTHQPRIVVELGGGTSTIWLGHALRAIDGARLISVEHDDDYAARTSQVIAAHELADIVEVRIAPLVDVRLDGDVALWYDPKALEDIGSIDLLVVDGPPAGEDATARYPALPVLQRHLSVGALVVLDDATRTGESDVVDRWCREFAYLRRIPTILGNIAVFSANRAAQ
jgi:predicted O-methyltransferase YrrM